MAKSKNNVWAIAYINRKFIDNVESELNQYEYSNVKAYIPTVKLLRKQFKGKRIFEVVPLLFNYGFFNIPYELACNPEFLSELRQRIGCIYAWVKDPIKTMTDSPRLRPDNDNFITAIPKTALATDQEVSRMIKASKDNSIFTEVDLKQVKPGDHIKLEGYPFEGIPAKILDINHNKGTVKVELEVDSIIKDVTVSFENVFYTIYKDFKEDSRESSTDELKHRYGNNIVDHINYKKHH